jgi:hypothetical protein
LWIGGGFDLEGEGGIILDTVKRGFGDEASHPFPCWLALKNIRNFFTAFSVNSASPSFVLL